MRRLWVSWGVVLALLGVAAVGASEYRTRQRGAALDATPAQSERERVEIRALFRLIEGKLDSLAAGIRGRR